MKKRLLSILLTLCMMLTLLPPVATAATNSGTGYSYDTGSKTLTISANSGPENFYTDHFSLRGEVKTVIIANGVTAPNYYAFSGYTSLTSVTIPSSVTKIAAGTFSGCTSLTTITIPNTVTEMLDYVFYGCTALKNVTLPSGMTSIPKSTFSGCTSLESFTIPSNVTSIGESAFESCNNLKSITIPSQVTSIGADAFKNCTSLGSITIPSKVSSIGEWAFYNCTSLTSAIFQNSMTALPQSIFYNCGNLSSVTLPSNLQTIGLDAFRSCTSLSSINIPSTVTLIDSRAFRDCSNLSAVNFASTSALDVINDYSFDGCSSLSFIIIPSKVTRLGYNAFSGCTNITAVFDPPVAPVLDAYGIVFQNADGYKLYVPKTGTGYSGYGWTNLVVGNVGLSNLTLSSGELSPAFSFNQYSYTATVPTGTGSITVTPTSFRGETITVNGTSVVSGQPSNAISLTGDTTTVTIQAAYGTTVETYTIQVTKAPAIVDIFTLDDKVTTPIKNGTPSATAIDTAQYTGTVSWKDASEAAVGSNFLGGTAYTATVTLTPKQGYTFKGVSANTFTYTNATVTHAAGGDGDLVASIKFSATAARTLSSIAITAQPKTSYKYGETFSSAGMVVKATYDDGTTDNNFTNYTIDKTGPLYPSDTTVTLTAAGTSITATQPITVAARVLTSIAVTTQPKMTYQYGETFNTAGMVVTANYEDGATDSNFTDYTVDKTGPLTMGDTTVTITARGTAIKTTLNITINRADGPAAPGLTFSFDGANANKLMGANSTMQYSLDGGVAWSNCTEDMMLADTQISADKDIKVRIKETSTTLAGETQTIDILAGPAAPNGITATDCTTTENNNGKLSGITTAMEYKLSTTSSWMAVSSSEITGLISGTYDVRLKATGQTLPGSPSSVTISPYIPATVSSFVLDSHVTTPAKNGTPNIAAIETTQYTGTVSWMVTSGAAVGSKYLGGTAYTATVTLTPKYGYTFSGVSANSFTYSNAIVTHSAGDDGNLIVSIAFPATAARELVSIAITTQPEKKSYKVGETFDKTGMVVTATYDDGTTDSNFTDYTVDKTDPLKSIDSSVTVTANNTSISSQQLIEVSKLDGPPAPTVTFSFDGENANKLMGAATSMQYSLDDGISWSDCSENMDLSSADISTSGIKVRLKETETTKAGEVKTISISKAATPIATASNATVSGKGTIAGVATEMEYKLSTDSTWTSGDGNPISLDPGTYHVRVKATGTVLASDSQELTIAEFVKGTPTKFDLTYSLTALVYDGNAKPLSVTAVSSKNLGAITVYYNGNAIAPANAGTYGITVDIAGNAEYNAVTGLSLGNYIIEKADHTGETTAFKTVRAYKSESNLTIALPTDLPEGASYAASGTVGATAALIASHSVDGTTLTFSTASHAATSATITIPVTGAKNYNDYDVVVTITAEDKEIVTISGLTAASNLVYDGMPQIGYTGTVAVSDNKVPTNELLYTYTSTDAGGYNATTAPANAGVYKLVVSVADTNDDYTGAHADITFTIAKATITVTAKGKSAYVGGTAPVLGDDDYTVTGLVSGETLKTKPTIAYASAPDMTKTGTMAINITGAVAPNGSNYNAIIYEEGVLTISNRPSSGGGGSYTPPLVTEIDNGGSMTGADLDRLVSGGKTLTVDGDNGAKLVFGTDALKGIVGQTSGSIKVEMKDVSADYKNEHPDRLVVSLTITAGGKHITNFGNGTATVSLPYELKTGEKAEEVTVWYLAEDGTMSEVPCSYDSATKLATFKVNHFSLYVVGTKDDASWANPFSDVEASDWYYSAVQYAAQNGLMKGTGNNTFSPGLVTNRGMIATILYNLDGSGETAQSTFNDVKPDAYYANAVAWAQKKGIITGYGNGMFGPDDSITREQLAAMLWKYAGSPAAVASKGLASFKDAGEISAYAQNALAWANQTGIITGKGGGVLDPQGQASRAEAAQIMQNFFQKSGLMN